MKRLIILAALIASGCASMTPEEASFMNSYRLCSNLAAPLSPNKEVIRNELRNRGEDCGQYMGAIESNRNASIQNAATGAQIMNASRPAPPPRIPTCTYTNMGGTIVQHCN